jgi:hypothetical protein
MNPGSAIDIIFGCIIKLRIHCVQRVHMADYANVRRLS